MSKRPDDWPTVGELNSVSSFHIWNQRDKNARMVLHAKIAVLDEAADRTCVVRSGAPAACLAYGGCDATAIDTMICKLLSEEIVGQKWVEALTDEIVKG